MLRRTGELFRGVALQQADTSFSDCTRSSSLSSLKSGLANQDHVRPSLLPPESLKSFWMISLSDSGKHDITLQWRHTTVLASQITHNLTVCSTASNRRKRNKSFASPIFYSRNLPVDSPGDRWKASPSYDIMMELIYNDNVIITSKRRCNVLRYPWRYHYVMCPLGSPHFHQTEKI